MATSEEKLDNLVEGMTEGLIDLAVLTERVNSIDNTLQTRAEALRNIYDFMQKTDSRLIKLEACAENEAKVKSWFAPYVLAVFSSMVGYLVFHFLGR
jgi:hypothetical protein